MNAITIEMTSPRSQFRSNDLIYQSDITGMVSLAGENRAQLRAEA